MKMLISGGTGMIGHALSTLWLAEGHEVIIITRSLSAPKRIFPNQQPQYISWTQLKQSPDSCLDVDVVVNLAGETINQRWSSSAKTRILSTRLLPARALRDWARSLDRTLPLYLSASGISVYGPSHTGVFDETSPAAGEDFLSDIVRQWEAEADQVPAERNVKLRIAPVLMSNGGAFPSMLLPFKLFFGGPIGNGKQPFSWIHIQDLVRLIDFIVKDTTINGIVNASAPETVSNKQFGHVIAKVYQRPYWFPVPAFMLKLIFGEMSTMLLDGQRVYPAKALEHGFTFQYGTAERAIKALRAESSSIKKEVTTV